MSGTAAAHSGAILLADREARLLHAHLQRHRRWNDAAHVRIVIATAEGASHIGIYAAPPMGVVSYVQLPLIGIGGTGTDAMVSAREIGFEARAQGLTALALPSSGPGVADLAVLPPTDGWHLPIHGIASDVMPSLEEAVAEFKTRSVSSPDPDALAHEIWSRPVFGGLTMRMLHAARLLGMLTSDSARIAASTRTGWKRLTTIRGQVYQRVPRALDRPTLTVVR